jgi:hypothetical protein
MRSFIAKSLVLFNVTESALVECNRGERWAGTCIPCAAGTSLPGAFYETDPMAAETQCVACAIVDGLNTYSVAGGACAPNCPAGYEKAQSGQACVMCEASTYSIEGGVCAFTCPKGFQIPASGTICESCEHDYYSIAGGVCGSICPAGYEIPEAGHACVVCRADTYSIAGSKCNSKCPANYEAPMLPSEGQACFACSEYNDNYVSVSGGLCEPSRVSFSVSAFTAYLISVLTAWLLLMSE